MREYMREYMRGCLRSKDHELELLLMFLELTIMFRRGDMEELGALVEGICVVEEFMTEDYVARQVFHDMKWYVEFVVSFSLWRVCTLMRIKFEWRVRCRRV